MLPMHSHMVWCCRSDSKAIFGYTNRIITCQPLDCELVQPHVDSAPPLPCSKTHDHPGSVHPRREIRNTVIGPCWENWQQLAGKREDARAHVWWLQILCALSTENSIEFCVAPKEQNWDKGMDFTERQNSAQCYHISQCCPQTELVPTKQEV